MKETRSLGLKEARMIVDAVIKAAEKDGGPPMVAAVVDRYGHLVYQESMDGASALAVRMPVNKCYSAIDAMRDTIEGRKYYEKLNLKVYEFHNPIDHPPFTYSTIPGGCLIKMKDGTVVGAVGTSGRAPMEDEEFARIGVKAFEGSEAFKE